MRHIDAIPTVKGFGEPLLVDRFTVKLALRIAESAAEQEFMGLVKTMV